MAGDARTHFNIESKCPQIMIESRAFFICGHYIDPKAVRLSQHPSSFTLHPSPFILHPSSFTLHPSPFILHPSPFTLHPSPFTLHSLRHFAQKTSVVFDTSDSRPRQSNAPAKNFRFCRILHKKITLIYRQSSINMLYYICMYHELFATIQLHNFSTKEELRCLKKSAACRFRVRLNRKHS